MDERRPPLRDPDPEAGLAEVVDRVGGRIANAIVIAAMIVGVALYVQPGPARYQVSADDGRIVRIDTRRGTVIACEDGRCTRVLRRGQRLERSEEPGEEKQAEPARQLPAPQQPSPAEAPVAPPSADAPAQPTGR